MRILLVSPRETMSAHNLSEVREITGCPAFVPNIALPTLAALAPANVEVTIVDENVQPIDFDEEWDLVGITGYITHRKRIFDIADEFRHRKRLVAIGGPYASLSPEAVRPHADILFIGEAEKTWPQFLQDLLSGCWKKEYRASESIDLASSPIPAIRRLQRGAYHLGVVQTSRGCPFECEFCDVIVYLGRRQRYKSPERVVEEVEQWYQAGYRWCFLADDNFTTNRRKARDIMIAIRDWNVNKHDRMLFSTQFSIDVARPSDVPLLDLCCEAGMKMAFIGIETPKPEGLLEVRKRQNLLGGDLIRDVHVVQKSGIIVEALMIVGFDSDSTDTFNIQYDFLQAAGVPLVVVSLLNAPEGTPLEKRILSEHRLRHEPMDDFFLDTNIVPKGMSYSELKRGASWLWNKLYHPSSFLERTALLAQLLPKTSEPMHPKPEALRIGRNIILAYKELGPDFAMIPQEVVKLLGHKDQTVIAPILLFYKHIVTMLQKWGIWDPTQASLKEPALHE